MGHAARVSQVSGIAVKQASCICVPAILTRKRERETSFNCDQQVSLISNPEHVSPTKSSRSRRRRITRLRPRGVFLSSSTGLPSGSHRGAIELPIRPFGGDGRSDLVHRTWGSTPDPIKPASRAAGDVVGGQMQSFARID